MSYKKSYWLFFLLILFLGESGFTQKLLKGPYLIEPAEKEMVIRWETDIASEGYINYGANNSLNKEVKSVLRGIKNGGHLYEVLLKDLSPDSTYAYKVILGDEASDLYQFRTSSPPQTKFNFVAMGDSRSNPPIFQKIIDRVQSESPDLIISMGDLVENGGNYSQWEEFYFSVAQKLIAQIPLVSTLGDHEGDGDNGELFRHFLRADQSTDKQWFSFDYGNAHFISLDYRHPDSEEMINWFIQDISSSDARWNFVYMHRPCYNLGGHRSAWGRDSWPALFRKYKVDIVFAGHSHQYERFYPVKSQDEPQGWPVTYITTGGAGAGLYEVTQNPYLAKAESVNHYLNIEISGDTLQARVFRNDDSVLDEFSIIKENEYFANNYLALVKPQEDLDILTMFTKAISLSLTILPLEEYPTHPMVELKSTVNYEIPFTIQLAESSAGYYKMDTYSGVLQGNEKKQIPLSIYSKSNVTISGWGSITPVIKLQVIYKNQSVEQVVEGGAFEYWPEEDY